MMIVLYLFGLSGLNKVNRNTHYPKSNMTTALLRDALVGMGEGEGKTCKQLERVLFEDGQVVDEDL